MTANPVRGEVDLQLGEDKFVLATTMRQLGRFSRATGCETMQQFFSMLAGGELNTTLEGLNFFTVSAVTADGKKLIGEAAGKLAEADFTLSDMDAVRTAFVGLLDPFIRKKSPAEEPDLPNGESAQNA